MMSYEYFGPFDKAYELVTQRVRERAAAATSSNKEDKWLERLICEFQKERMEWNKERFEDYHKEWKRLRFGLAKLAAGAYLHISYDLPRVIADEWPGSKKWPLPSKAQGTSIYFALDTDFLDIWSIVAKEPKIIGLPAYVLKPFSRKILRSATHWVLLLRRAAWQHADQLRLHPNRAYVEQKMLFAVTAALKDVSDLPWTIGMLLPPDSAFAPAVLPGWFSELNRFWAEAGAAIVLALVLATWARRNWNHYDELSSFIEELGIRTYEYVSFAILDPEGFDQYRLKRRDRDGARGRIRD